VTFDAAANQLHDFYILAGTGSATLVGLLFVGLSLHIHTVIAVPEVRSLARFTLANFGAVLFAAMFLVINQGQINAGFQLIGVAAVTLVVVASRASNLFRAPQGLAMARSDRIRVFVRFGSSLLGYVAVGAAGVLLLLGQIELFTLFIEVALVLLLVVALRNTWDLLVTVAEITNEEDQRERPKSG
jgi:hypothetical protein